MFGPEDGFFTRFARMARLTPVLPLIGGSTKFQPAYVGDVADAIAAALARPDAQGQTYELGGPRTYTMKELLRYITHEIDRPRMLLPIPMLFAAPLGYTIGALSKLNPFFGPPLTGDQVQLLRSTMSSRRAKTFADLITTLGAVDPSPPPPLTPSPARPVQPPHLDEIRAPTLNAHRLHQAPAALASPG
jgi:NADH dehydrogenase